MSKALATKNVAAVLVAAALIAGFAFTFAAPAKADTLSSLQAQVQALLAQIASLQGGSSMSGGGSMMSSASCHTFTMNEKLGANGGEVMWLQQFLNGNGFPVAASGAGSPGNETSHFGPATKAAVIKFQNAHAADILTPVGLTAGTGTWGPSSRAKANAMCAGAGTGTTGTGTGTGTGTVTPTGPGITVSASVQPANSLAPAGAVRVPFTTFTLTNNTGAAVTINGINVQRTGQAQDNNFSGIVLVDSNGLQVGVSHTFDSNHMALIGDTFTLAAGATQTYTVAGNIAAVSGSIPHSGEVPTIAVTGVNTSVPVSGSLPITGASQTINTTLTVGTVSIGTSSFDPNGATTKHIGDTAIKFSGIRFTAGSGEDLKFYSIRWRINGSVGPSDLANITTNVNGTSYPTVLSADGRYYVTTFPGGILVSKGNSVDVYVQGDIVGTNAAGRQAEFDIDKTSDVYFVGQTYGYGIAVSASSGGTYSTSMPHGTGYDTTKQPWFSGSTVTIAGGSVTTIQNATGVASQNVALNVPNVVLGGFQTNFTGEPVTVQGMKFNILGMATGTTDQITLVSVTDENGAVVEGPNDASGNIVSFTNSVTFPTGIHTYTIKGKLPSTFSNGGTIQVQTSPKTWTNPQGQSTGNSVDLSGFDFFTMNTMTVRGASFAVSASQNPAAQNVVAGAQNQVFGNIQLDASQSGEDIKLNSIPVNFADVAGFGDGATYLSSCQLWNGSTALTTGSNVKTSVSHSYSGTDNTFTLDNSLTIPKGTVVTLAVGCNLSSSATTSAFKVGIQTAPTATGVQSGSNANVTLNAGYSGNQTVASGASVALSVDPSSPSYAVQAGGTTGVTVGVIKLRSANEAFNLTKIGLTTLNGTFGSASTGAGNTATGAGDLTTVYLYSGSTLLGTATFSGTSNMATSSFSTPFLVPRDTDTQITIKADLANIGVSSAGGIGNLIKVDPIYFEGTGVSSGSTVKGTSSAGYGTNNTAGVRLFKSYPTLALDTTLSSSGVADGRLIHFKITANSSGPVGINQFGFNVATTSATVTNYQLFGFTDAGYSQGISGQGNGGQIGTVTSPASVPVNGNFTIAPTTNPVEVPAGQTYFFELRGTVTGVISGSSVVTKLLGDSTYPSTMSGWNVATSSSVGTAQAFNFVWSGNSTTTATATDVDWSNGQSLPGLPSSGLIQSRSN